MGMEIRRFEGSEEGEKDVVTRMSRFSTRFPIWGKGWLGEVRPGQGAGQ